MIRAKSIYLIILLWFIITVIFLHHWFWFNSFYQTNPVYLQKINILWWTEMLPNYSEQKNCGIFKCHFTSNRKYLNNSDTRAVIFYGSNMELDDFPLPRLNHHNWILFHEESPKNVPYVQHEDFLKHFNYTATFSRYSNFPLTTQYLQSYDVLRSRKFVVPVGTKTKLRNNLAPIVYLQSICDTLSRRDDYVKELMKFIPVDSYGNCLNNKQLPESLKNDYLLTIDSDELYTFLGRYKFIISYENGVCNDYITEKLWRPLIIGSIPIYFGSPKIKDWLPNNKSAILITDFNSPQDLANFIKKLDNNDTEYNTYLDHKYSQIEPITNILLKDSLFNRDYNSKTLFEDIECFVCKKLYKSSSVESNHATKQHYDCPKNVIYPKMNTLFETNGLHAISHNGKCEAAVLDRLFKENRNYTIEHYKKYLISDMLDKKCDI